MSSFAIYRLPHAQTCTTIIQYDDSPQVLQSLAQLGEQSGFVLAPFCISSATPLLLIRPDLTECTAIDQLKEQPFYHQTEDTLQQGSYETYQTNFELFRLHLATGTFKKLVLARSSTHRRQQHSSPIALFQRACQLYPRLFISLVSTPQSGTWLAATPEILLESQDNHWRTIALAGTRQLHGSQLQGEGEDITWDMKNIQEQRYVATYLSEQLRPFVHTLTEEGPRTVRAANLVHLRSDFTFTLLNNARVGHLLQAFHPTPAVCGLPKQKAFNFILHHEHTPRLYYSGFMGPLSPTDTHLYVSLRCMQICQQSYRLYAGGGLLKNSVLEQEWQETEAKMETMRQLITH